MVEKGDESERSPLGDPPPGEPPKRVTQAAADEGQPQRPERADGTVGLSGTGGLPQSTTLLTPLDRDDPLRAASIPHYIRAHVEEIDNSRTVIRDERNEARRELHTAELELRSQGATIARLSATLAALRSIRPVHALVQLVAGGMLGVGLALVFEGDDVPVGVAWALVGAVLGVVIVCVRVGKKQDD